MQLSNYGSFPASLPIIIEDEIFLYPFMIAPLFLSDEKMIKAASFAVENNSLILVCHSKNGMEDKANSIKNITKLNSPKHEHPHP